MDARDAVKILSKYPLVVRMMLRDWPSRYITITDIAIRGDFVIKKARTFMYQLMNDGIIERYQTSFRLTEIFLEAREGLK